MGIWVTLQDRYLFLIIFMLIIFVNIVLLYAAWKNRSTIPKGLIVLVCILCSLIIVISLVMFIFILSFGYNS